MSKKTIKQLYNYLLVFIGTLILAFGSVIFLSECELVAGGVSGIAIIFDHFFKGTYDYAIAVLIVVCWLLGLIFISKDFAMKTLLSSVLYIGFTFLFKRVPFFGTIAQNFAGTAGGAVPQVGNLILCGLFGGVFVGAGVAITFIGGGSTGGVDVFQMMMRKYFNIKESIGSFVIDGTVVAIGMIVMQMWIPALCGILSSFVAAVLIEMVYIHNQTSYQVDIISDHWKEISEYAQVTLDRGTTIIPAEGGYKGDKRVILRIVFDKSQYDKIRNYIASIDPHAFITFTQTNAVYGEGFNSNKKSNKIVKK